MSVDVGLPPAHELETLNDAQLGEVLDLLFENSAPFVPDLVGVSFTNWDAVLAAAARVISRLSPAGQVGLLRGHARLGEDPGVLARVSPTSYREQRAPGSESPHEDAHVRHELLALGQVYEARFGFPFVEFVAGRPLVEIVPVLQQRLTNSSEVELATALTAMVQIAASRVTTFAPTDQQREQ